MANHRSERQREQRTAIIPIKRNVDKICGLFKPSSLIRALTPLENLLFLGLAKGMKKSPRTSPSLSVFQLEFEDVLSQYAIGERLLAEMAFVTCPDSVHCLCGLVLG